MTKMHIVYDTQEQTAYPNRRTAQFALCGVWVPTGEQVCVDDPLWLDSSLNTGFCKRCKAKAVTLTESKGGTLVVKPGYTVPAVRQAKPTLA